VQRGQAGCKAAGRNQRGHLTGDLVERAAASGDAQFLGVLPEHDGLIAAIEDFFQVGVGEDFFRSVRTGSDYLNTHYVVPELIFFQWNDFITAL